MMTETRRWKKRPPGSTWGDFGPDDQIGRLNLVTPEKVLAAIQEVRAGRTFCLSLPLDFPGGNVLNPRRKAPVVRPLIRNNRPAMNYPLSLEQGRATDIICDDAVELALQHSTQWDSLAHVGQMFDADGDGTPEMVFYNGYRADIDIDTGSYCADCQPSTAGRGASRLGIENMASTCVQGRGVMVDLVAHCGTEKRPIGYRELEAIMKADRIEVEEGDFVCFHTGVATALLGMNRQPDKEKLSSIGVGLDGRDKELQEWITESGVVALIADNNAVEIWPARDGTEEKYSFMPLHEHCLFRLGVYLGEYWYLDELANWLRKNGRTRFLLTAPPLRLPGAVGSPVTPVATV